MILIVKSIDDLSFKVWMNHLKVIMNQFNLQSLFLLGIGWSIEFFSANFAIIFFKPFEGVSWIIIVNHALNFDWVIVEVAESSAYVISLNVMKVNIVTNACCQ